MRRVEGQESEEREITHVSVHGGSSNVGRLVKIFPSRSEPKEELIFQFGERDS